MRSVVLGLGLILLSAATAVAEGEKCCFTNPSFTGACEETPAPAETCQSILEYLNTPNSAGKAYCDGTSIRGGWKPATCGSAPKASSTGPVERKTVPDVVPLGDR